MLDFQLVPRSGQYVCAEVILNGDIDAFSNRKCLSLTGEQILFPPYPNPAKTELNMDWISIDGSDVTFQIVNSTGSLAFQQIVDAVVPGINRLLVNTSGLSPGIYYIRFRDQTTDKTFNFAVTGN
jgi:hypothetical protein